MKVIVDKDIPFIKGRLEPFFKTVYADGKSITPDMVRDADALIIRTRTKCGEELLKNSAVKLICTATIGEDHIDKKVCEDLGIEVKSAPGCNAPGVAQYVITSILKTGFNKEKDILGVVGYGNVGSLVKLWADKINIRTKVCDPPRKDLGFNDVDYRELQELIETCDVLTFHVPLTVSEPYGTWHLIGEKEMAAMKPGTIIINTSRGGVVDERAWKCFLKRGKLMGIADVWENEPQIDNSLLSLMEFGTPHIAGYSLEGKKRATRFTLANIDDFFGIETDKSGLETVPLRKDITEKSILDSYSPTTDSRNLKNDPSRFEFLRNHYHYRHEPGFLD